MLKKITLVCGIAFALSALAVVASLPAYAAASDTAISADALPGLCAAGGGHVAVPSNSVLKIQGGTALISGECDITPGDNASVFIEDAVIDARPAGGDFDICVFPFCGTNVTVHVDSSTIYEGGFGYLTLYAPGSSGLMKVENSTLSSPSVIDVTSDGTTVVENTTFEGGPPFIVHGGVTCHSENNTPAVSCS